MQAVCAWDLIVFPDGSRSYRLGVERIPADAQVHQAGTPAYKAEVALLRAQAQSWFAQMADTSRPPRVLPASCPCPRSSRGMEGNKNAVKTPDPSKPPTRYALRHKQDRR